LKTEERERESEREREREREDANNMLAGYYMEVEPKLMSSYR